jgi:cyclophilin family peptidyl-prolyl cis-trans isomerase
MAEMTLTKGTVVIRLLGREAPIHVLNFKKLAEKGVYNGLRIHRVVPNFVIQGGDPRGDGWGGAGENIHDQFNRIPYKRGAVGMPTAGKDTGGSQFFITMSRQPHLDGNYTVFGEVISGMEFVDSTEIGDSIVKVQIKPSPNSTKARR